MRRPPKGLQPTVEWQVCGRCNYDCSYCIQSRASRQGAPGPEKVHAIIAGLAKLPGSWEIKMSGGEPFAAPSFLSHAVPGLVEHTGHTLSVLTNLSAPLRELERFCLLAGRRLRVTSASLHLESTPLEAFIDRALAYVALTGEHNPQSTFVINAVLVPGTLRRHLAIRERLEGLGLTYFPQLMKIRGGVYPYSGQEQDIITEITRGSLDPRQVNRAPSYEGHRCEAGRWYFVVDQGGQAFVCRSAKRYLKEDESGLLGSLAEGTFARLPSIRPCPYPLCPCTVPANRGIVRPGGRHGL